VTFLRDFFFVYVLIVGAFGLIKTQNAPKSYWTTFPWFLLLVGAMDGFGLFINEYLSKEYPKLNFYYYQLFAIPLQVIYYMWIINKNIISKKKLFIIGSIIFYLSAIVEALSLFKTDGYFFNSVSYMIANVIMLANILRYFYQLSKSDRILVFYQERMFWVCLGLLIFWLGALPFFGIFNYLLKHFHAIFIIYFNVILIFNYLMYTCFLVSFLWTERERS
jgi:hypothetical protein